MKATSRTLSAYFNVIFFLLLHINMYLFFVAANINEFIRDDANWQIKSIIKKMYINTISLFVHIAHWQCSTSSIELQAQWLPITKEQRVGVLDLEKFKATFYVQKCVILNHCTGLHKQNINRKQHPRRQFVIIELDVPYRYLVKIIV